jgi:hypothetical protein
MNNSPGQDVKSTLNSFGKRRLGNEQDDNSDGKRKRQKKLPSVSLPSLDESVLTHVLFPFLDMKSHFRLVQTSKALSLAGNRPGACDKQVFISDSKWSKFRAQIQLFCVRCQPSALIGRIADADMKSVETGGQRLRYLDIHDSRITDAGMSDLSSLSALTYLNLRSCTNITDTGLAHLSSLSALTHLDLSFCTNISNTGLAHVSSLPNCRIYSSL